MSNVTVDLDVGFWINYKGQVELFVGDDLKPVEMIPLLELIKREVESHKKPGQEHIEWDDVKQVNKLKKALLNCTAYLTQEIVNAK